MAESTGEARAPAGPRPPDGLPASPRRPVGPIGVRARLGPFCRSDLEHLLDARDLDARAARRLAERALVAVDRFPAGVGDKRRLALAEQSLHRLGARLGRLVAHGGAVAVARESDWLMIQGDALRDRAHVLCALGRPEDARADLNEAIALYDKKGIVVSRAMAEHVLQSLPRPVDRQPRVVLPPPASGDGDCVEVELQG